MKGWVHRRSARLDYALRAACIYLNCQESLKNIQNQEPNKDPRILNQVPILPDLQ